MHFGCVEVRIDAGKWRGFTLADLVRRCVAAVGEFIDRRVVLGGGESEVRVNIR